MRKNCVKISLVNNDDLEAMRKIRNSNFVNAYVRVNRLISKRDQQIWYESIKENDKIRCFVIKYKNEIVGGCNVSKKYIDSRVAEFGIYICKNKSNLGIGKVALKKMIDYSFENFNVNKIFGEVFSFNVAAMKMYLGLGFNIEARLKNHVFKDDMGYDVYIVSVFKEDWK